ncbi:MAG TPA: 50S ribosomal protein L4 [Chloroflexia bacterium]
MQANVYNLAGEVVRSIELDDAIFGIEPNMAVVHQAVVRQQANARQGTANTRTRANVRGGGRKPWRQKGTGRARQGSTRSPQWTHGGVVFGPHTRSYEQPMPRKMRRLAIRSVLSGKARDGQLVLVESFQDIEPRTRVMSDTLKNLNITDKSSALIFTTGETNLLQAASNLGKVKTLSAHLLSVVDMLKYDYVVLPIPSLEVVTSILGNQGGRNKHELNGDGDGFEEEETPRETPRAGAPTLNYTTTAEVQAEAATIAAANTADTADTADNTADATTDTTDEATADTGVEAESSDETSSLADVDVTATAAEAGDTEEEA